MSDGINAQVGKLTSQMEVLSALVERLLLERHVSAEHLDELDSELAAVRGEVDYLLDEDRRRIVADYNAAAGIEAAATAPSSSATACHLTVVKPS